METSSRAEVASARAPLFSSVDIKSGLVLSLIALPLSVGISLASGAPPTAGLISAIVGGMLGALIGGCELAINGPAAGLIVIVLGSIDSLGGGDPVNGFHRMLGCLVMAGLLQVVFGLIRAGKLALAVPTSVVHGMLMGIGVIIMIKQIPVLAGAPAQSKSMWGILLETPAILGRANWEIAFIGLASVAILVAANLRGARFFKWIPAPLVVVAFGLGMDRIFDLEHVHQVEVFHRVFDVGPQYLLKLPANVAETLFGASFQDLFSRDGFKAIASIAIVGSIESILSVSAIDRMDPFKRKSNFDRELISKGICNAALGFLGGLPIIAEIVRSSANISSGARTRYSNFFHGAFILIFVLLFSDLLRSIPLSALAGILAVVGFRLAHPKQLLHSWHVGWDQWLVFTTTLLLTVFEDLLVGVAVGVLLEIALNAVRSQTLTRVFKCERTTKIADEHGEMAISSPLVFSNFIQIQDNIEQLRGKASAVIDLRGSHFIDHSVMERLHGLQHEFESQGKKLTVRFHEQHRSGGKHELSSRMVSQMHRQRGVK